MHGFLKSLQYPALYSGLSPLDFYFLSVIQKNTQCSLIENGLLNLGSALLKISIIVAGELYFLWADN